MYLYGPLGPIARTAEYGNNDVSDNRTVYYLRDAMGGHTGLLLDHDADLSTPSQASFSVYDAFGNGMSPGSPSGLAGSFAWRGGEGSVRDAAPNLVYMQARHYDPTIGRFLQPDTMTLASTTTQGMNKYIYCENDPVNRSDPTGKIWHFVVGLLFAGLVGGFLNWAASGFDGGFGSGAVAGIISAAAVMGLAPYIGFTLAGAVGGGLASGVTARMGGGSWRQARDAALLGAFFGGLLGFLAGFSSGASTSRDILGFNEVELAYWLFGIDIEATGILVGRCILSKRDSNFGRSEASHLTRRLLVRGHSKLTAVIA